MHTLKVGCCGFAKGMEQYCPQFQLVEVQQTFYKPPQVETALRWRTQAPHDFEFAIKAWQLITHPPSSPTYRKAGIDTPRGRENHYGFFRPTEEVLAAWHRTEEVAMALRAEVVLFQCPPRFREDEENVENMRAFFRALGRGRFTFVWEPRGQWSEDGIVSLCRELDLIHCVDPTEKTPLYGQPHYFRLHGGPGYRHTYSGAELRHLAQIGRAGDYFLFNNLAMYADALRFKRLLAEEE